MMDFATYERRAGTAAKQFQERRDAVLNDGRLSDEGKRAALALARETYNAAVAALRSEVEHHLQTEREAVAGKLKALRAKRAGEFRALVGSEVAFSLLERECSALSPEQLIERLADAADAWEVAVIGRLGLALLPVESTDVRVALARQTFTQAVNATDPERSALEREARDLQHVRLERLDPVGYSVDLSRRYGVPAEFVPVSE